MSAENATSDLNAVISSAVQARIETEVAAALAGSELMNQYVAAALTQKIQVGDDRDRYKKRETTFLAETIKQAIREATAAAVRKVVADEQEAIEAAVTTELRKNVKSIAKQITSSVVEAAEKPYGVKVEMLYPSNY